MTPGTVPPVDARVPRVPLPALPLRTWLVTSHLLALVLPALVIVGTGALGAELRQQTRVDLENQGNLVAVFLGAEVAAAPARDVRGVAADLSPLLAAARERTLAAIRVVDPSATVVASSGEGLGERLVDHPEVVAALGGRAAMEIRPRDPPTRNDLGSESRRAGVRLFVAVPIRVGDDVKGAVLLSRTPMEEVQALYRLVPWRIAALAAVTTLATALIAANSFARSLAVLAEAAAALASGRLEDDEGLADPSSSRVAEVRSLARTFAQTAARLRRRLGATAELAGNVAHEFRTPIATLRGTTELLRDDPEMPIDRQRRFLDTALGELDRLDRTVGGLLALARAEAPGRDERVDLAAIASAVARRHGLTPPDGAPAWVHGNPAQLDGAIDNLVQNAQRHGRPPVTVRVRVDAGRAQVSVANAGPSIPEANQQRLFERFFSTDRARGTGLGLALVRAIAEAHRGQVTFRSAQDDTVFTLELPCALSGLP